VRGRFQAAASGQPFERRRWEIADGLVEPAGVEPADVLDDGELELARVRQTRSAISSVLKPSLETRFGTLGSSALCAAPVCSSGR
jgi:hypothetical protein